ncbi:MAG: MOSC domain-containing protein [Actinomycetota bacterium]|nr:MOSC domain-containing protein [Actinomycetota bacterium]
MTGIGKVVSVNIGSPRTVKVRGRLRATGIFKEPAAGRISVRVTGVGSDVQMDTKHHGGPYKAVYVYASEDYGWWSAELGVDLSSGTFGENLTTSGVDVSAALIGERWRAGTAVVEVTDPRIPCSTLGARMGVKGFVKTFARAERFGAYCRVVTEGDVATGDPVVLVHRPDHGVSIVDVARSYYAKDPARTEAIYVAAGRPEHFAGR